MNRLSTVLNQLSSSPMSSPSNFTPNIPIRVVATANAPKALATYSQAVVAGDVVYCSGCLGMSPETNAFVSEEINGQTEQSLKNVQSIIEAAGADLTSVVKVTILLASMDDYAAVNTIYGKFFPVNPPARSCFAVKTLPRNALVEIECVAIVGKRQ